MSVAIADNIQSKISSIQNYLKGITEFSDYELKVISDSVLLISSELPSTKLSITMKLAEVSSLKADLSFILLRLSDIRRSYNIPYTDIYNTKFTLLTKQGRPSKQAIESEMFYREESLRNYRDKISEIDNILEFLKNYSVLLDRISNILESRKFDL